MIKKLNLDEYERVLIYPDLHGEVELFDFSLLEMGVHHESANSKKTFVISLGDLHDRGDDSMHCLNYFLFNQKAIAIRGNHEELAINAFIYGNRTDYLTLISNGGEWTQKYSESYLRGLFLEVENKFPYLLKFEFNNKNYICSHAEYPFDDYKVNKLNKIDVNKILWSRDQFKNGYANKIKNCECSFHGHSVIDDGKIFKIENRYWLDGGACISKFSKKDHCLNVVEINKNGIVFHKFTYNEYLEKVFL